MPDQPGAQRDVIWSGREREIAARDFARNVPEQIRALGGKILRVNAAITTNRVCRTLDCNEALTEFIGDPEVTIEKGGFGFIRTATQQINILQGSFINAIRGRFGGASNLEAIANFVASEGVAVPPTDNMEP